MADLEKKVRMSVDEEPEKIDAMKGHGGSVSGEAYGVSERKLLGKLDLRILPAVSFLYLLSFLDRSNVGNAKIAGLTTSLDITGDQYLTGLTIFFVGYILFEVPFNIILKRTSPKFWLPSVTVVWGIVATLLGVVQNLAGFIVARFFLGVAEGALFPGVVYYLSMWYKRQERQYRVALFFSCASLAGAFGGLLAYGISFMDGVGGYEGWRWIFIIEGLFTFVSALLAYFFVCNYPDTAGFLKENEKAFLIHRLKADSDSTNDEGFTWNNVMKALKDPKCWLYAAAFHTMSLPLYTLSLFLPTFVADLGFENANAQLLTVPPYALATILTFIIAVISERLRRRAPFMMACSAFACIGYVILLANTDTKVVTVDDVATVVSAKPGIGYVGTFFAAAGIYPSTALALSLPAVNVSGQTKRAVACGLQITIGNLGAVIGTQLYRAEDAPLYKVGYGVTLAYLVMNIIVSAVTWWVLKKENVAKAAAMQNTEVDMHKPWEGDDDIRWTFTT